MTCPIETLPDSLLAHIIGCSMLDATDIVACQLVSKKWGKVVQEHRNSIAKQFMLRTSPSFYLVDYDIEEQSQFSTKPNSEWFNGMIRYYFVRQQSPSAVEITRVRYPFINRIPEFVQHLHAVINQREKALITDYGRQVIMRRGKLDASKRTYTPISWYFRRRSTNQFIKSLEILTCDINFNKSISVKRGDGHIYIYELVPSLILRRKHPFSRLYPLWISNDGQSFILGIRSIDHGWYWMSGYNNHHQQSFNSAIWMPYSKTLIVDPIKATMLVNHLIVHNHQFVQVYEMPSAKLVSTVSLGIEAVSEWWAELENDAKCEAVGCCDTHLVFLDQNTHTIYTCAIDSLFNQQQEGQAAQWHKVAVLGLSPALRWTQLAQHSCRYLFFEACNEAKTSVYVALVDMFNLNRSTIYTCTINDEIIPITTFRNDFIYSYQISDVEQTWLVTWKGDVIFVDRTLEEHLKSDETFAVLPDELP